MSSDTAFEKESFGLLSSRERQVLGMAAAGMLDKQIGQEIGVSLNTLRTYWTRIRAKVGDKPRAALVADFVTEDMKGAGAETAGAITHEGWILDVPTMTMMASDSVNDLHGLERGVPHPVSEYARLYHPEDRDTTRSALYDVIEGHVLNAHLIFRLALESGIELVHLTANAVVGQDGAVKRVYGYRTRSLDCRIDHDPRVRTGHWVRTFPEPFATIDDELADLIGRESGGHIPLSEVERYFLPGEVDEFVTHLEDAVKSGADFLQRDGRFVRSDGTVIWSRAIRRIERSPDGSILIRGTLSVFE